MLINTVLISGLNKQQQRKKMKNLYKEYQLYYLKKYNFKMLETYKQWLKRLKDIDSPLLTTQKGKND
jgi:hypothetical protein